MISQQIIPKSPTLKIPHCLHVEKNKYMCNRDSETADQLKSGREKKNGLDIWRHFFSKRLPNVGTDFLERCLHMSVSV